jgi:hypothetical protein
MPILPRFNSHSDLNNPHNLHNLHNLQYNKNIYVLRVPQRSLSILFTFY